MTREQYEKLKEWVRMLSLPNGRFEARAIEKELDKLMGFEE